ncbi:hypothetical protein [Janthinobacterium sp. PC23-8]|uniref:hypothetical protein n=1 Tax=Janthinobacterium sp. PC23-8 TaxID=2012679 RepID=UPI0011401F7D|nr:hypothetical protein [Janthinobacterium sp. PC23-8]
MADDTQWQYDPAEHRKKHCWNKPDADFVRSGSHIHGKCPNTLSKETAQVLLVGAISETTEADTIQPKKLWTVHEGVIYEAVPTRLGAYHGYPWCARPGMNRLPRQVIRELTQMAEKKGCLREFKDWIKKHG